MPAVERSAQRYENGRLHARGAAGLIEKEKGSNMRLGSLLAGALLLLQAQLAGAAAPSDRWFEEVKKNATPEQLYSFLYALPKGGDLHNHLTGAAMADWMWDAALATEKQGYIYYTKVAI